ncbi:MAG: peptide ABC transporter substrate-binding protein [Lachnospiraceae bacterium]|nr:peptide ABC transporter substrate-binding protein [Lachnospiraceae bacterium]
MKKFLALLLAAVMVLSLAACTQTPAPTDDTTKGADIEVETTTEEAKTTEAPAADTTEAPADDTTEEAVTDAPEPAGEDVEYVRGDDEEAYEAALGGYAELLAAGEAAESIDERFVLFAKAEAYLLDSAVMIPTTTQGGAYTISRVAPRTVPYVQWGNDDDRWHTMVISDEFITPDERAELLDMWAKAVAGEGEYNPAKYLTDKGHTLQTDYTTTFSTAPVTIDWLNTSSQADTEITVQTVDGLVEYNGLGQMEPALAESWDISEDGMVYTFHIRKGAYWYTSEGQQYAEVTAKDFEAGFHHMLDAKAGLEWLIDGVVKGGTDYYANGGSWDDVGYKATDDYTLVVTLEKPVSYFMTMLTYSCFLPICDSFYQAHGGVYGVEEFAEANADTDTYTYGKNTDVSSQVYCGPFLLQKLDDQSEIYCVKNENYYDAATTTLNSIKWVYDDGSNPDAIYNDALAGVYAGVTLGQASGLLDKAKDDGNFDKYAYISDTTSTSYFGGLNLNRGTFALESGACASPKTEQQKIDTNTALQNKNFRKALQYAFNKGAQNAVSRGEDLKLTNLRNMYTHPQFVQLEKETTVDGDTFAAGTFYGDIVQFYLDQMGCEVQVADQQDGWFHPEAAVEHLEAAKEELGDTVTFPIQIDVVYLSSSDTNTAQAAAYKESLESVLGTDNVIVNMVEATTTDDYYASGYRASNGEAGNFDMFYGSGWGPDYGDPNTYLNTFLGEGAGYMTKVIGLF